MSLVAQMCPDVEDMLFMYQDRVTCNLEVLGAFSRLRNLELWGSSFFKDSLDSLLIKIGQQLISLDLHHVDGLTREALRMLTTSCPHIVTLGLSNCDFTSIASRPQEFANRKWEPVMNLQELTISCPCPEPLLVSLLSTCFNLKKWG